MTILDYKQRRLRSAISPIDLVGHLLLAPLPQNPVHPA